MPLWFTAGVACLVLTVLGAQAFHLARYGSVSGFLNRLPSADRFVIADLTAT